MFLHLVSDLWLGYSQCSLAICVLQIIRQSLIKIIFFEVTDTLDEPRQLLFTPSRHSAIIRRKQLDVVTLKR
jgi:hypothetical protein